MISELSIITPTLNEEKYLPKLLNSIALQNFQGKMEVIVVDGKSEDHTISVAETFKNKLPDLSIIPLRKRGVGYQRNQGAQKAKYKYLLFIDADMILPRNFLNQFIKEVNEKESFVDIPNIWLAERDLIQWCAFLLMMPLFIAIVIFDKITPGLLILTTKENHIKIHGFREDLAIAEDTDYGWRSVAAGAKFHLHLFTYALHSARRIQRVGIVKFYYEHLYGYFFVKRNGIENIKKVMKHTYGDF